MEAVNIRDLEAVRPATWEELLLAHGLVPISDTEAEAHKAAELAKCPEATPFYAILKNTAVILTVTYACSAGAMIVLGVASVLTRSIALLEAGVCMYFLAMTVGWTIRRLDNTKIYDKPRWDMRTLEAVPSLRTPELDALTNKIGSAIGPGDVYCEVLVQNSVVLDPVWWYQQRGVFFCFAITDEKRHIIRSA